MSKPRSDRLKHIVHMRWWTERVIELSMGDFTKATVPCGICRHCCMNSNVDVTYEVTAGVKYRIRKDKGNDGKILLQHRKNKNCVYLGKKGCTLEDSKKPGVCRAYDCRNAYWYDGIPDGHPIWSVIEYHKRESKC